jgi:hypothetical protein
MTVERDSFGFGNRGYKEFDKAVHSDNRRDKSVIKKSKDVSILTNCMKRHSCHRD